MVSGLSKQLAVFCSRSQSQGYVKSVRNGLGDACQITNAALGKTGQSEKLFAICILGVGLMLQTVSICYVAIYLAQVPASAHIADSGAAAVTGSAKRAAIGGIAALYISRFGWAMSWNSFQYLVNAEI
ncbi:uncharacterized protein N7498_009264 [Penicillium cinerascens]|uniref:Major facilitator superfamily (MFS) profile domain-containing protein n=1 Tax=Penicillium cinerascens TaxID=70096 RepID=A0A9W9J5S3_9EURO|nr:uncharacterized protein N7498_009264 [Penicillium cinerascens]KAJ5190279.1 hypothetical protein N7498_009264 [Penicillium cinerascens]